MSVKKLSLFLTLWFLRLSSLTGYSAKFLQQDHETQRRNNAELVKMQEESSFRQEQARRATEEEIQAQQRQTEKERAQIEQETIRVKAMAEACLLYTSDAADE